MASTLRESFLTVDTQGGLLPAEFLKRLAHGATSRSGGPAGLSPTDYHLPGNERLNEAISHAWTRLLGAWSSYRVAVVRLAADDPATTVTREKWLLPLFQCLDYGRLQAAGGFEIESKSYPVSHLWGPAPIHLLGSRVPLDRRSPKVAGAARSSPHSLVQELLNRSDDHLWGFLSNGHSLRILRDNLSLTRQAYVEFDLEAMMEGQVYSDFILLWLLCHQSRIEGERPERCWLERWSREAQEQGIRALDKLRDGVRSAIQQLGRGFLAHPANRTLRDSLRSGALDKQDYYRQLLRAVYRLLFLFVSEDRDLLLLPAKKAAAGARDRYRLYYSTDRLRHLAGRRRGGPHPDLWRALRLVFAGLGDPAGCSELALPSLGGHLWDPAETAALDDCDLGNADLLAAIRALAYTRDGKVRQSVDYKNLGPEELGSVYEGLLEYRPEMSLAAPTFELVTAAGHERKTTGSYYTPTSLINALLDSALDPVLDEAAKARDPEAAILALKVCDPACGSGHFLIAAAHRIARRLAAARTGDEEPSPEALRHALRDVIGRCIYGVDLNPMALELCKVNLWLDSLEPGRPLSFLDHHLQCGNSLLGATPRLLAEGIPNDAFKPIEGDDKEVVKLARKENRDYRKTGQATLDYSAPWERLGDLATGLLRLEAVADSTSEGVLEKERRWREIVDSTEYEYSRLWADAWCAAFVWRKVEEGHPWPITEETFRNIERNPHHVSAAVREEVRRLAEEYGFFHWHLAFPEVFRVSREAEEAENAGEGWNGGFDLVLGNPPWEKIDLRLEEYFARSHPEIAKAGTKARRLRLLESLRRDDPLSYRAYNAERRHHDGLSHFFRQSGVFPLTGLSRINLYSVFAELDLALVAPRGSVGLIIHSGIATDSNNQYIFQELVQSSRLRCIYDFENRDGIFIDVHRSFKFCLFVASGSAATIPQPTFAFFLRAVEDRHDDSLVYGLSKEDLRLINPESGTCPIFRTARDARLARMVYRQVKTLGSLRSNFGYPKTPFNMANDSHLFVTVDDLRDRDMLFGPFWVASDGDAVFLPLYEGKLVDGFNHRAYTMSDLPVEERIRGRTRAAEGQELADASFGVSGRYWIERIVKIKRYPGSWHLVFRTTARSTDQRTSIAAVLGDRPCGHTLNVIQSVGALSALSLCAALNSFAFDYFVRQKIGGASFTHWIYRQLPIPMLGSCRSLHERLALSGTLGLGKCALELIYTAWDLEAFARDCGRNGPPFRWDEDRRFLLRCELDAAFFHLYGIERDDVDYIMETFPIVKRKDIKAHGEYRTKLMILDIYDRMKSAIDSGEPYQTLLDPPPADPRVAHPDDPEMRRRFCVEIDSKERS